MKRSYGLTLIELLIALAISSIIALGTFILFNTSINTKNTLTERSEELSQVSRALRIIERDFLQYAPYRPVKDAFGQYQEAMLMDQTGLYLTRSGWAHSPFMAYERSILQRVHYHLASPGSPECAVDNQSVDYQPAHCLIRRYTAQLDDNEQDWLQQPIFKAVKSIEWRFLVFNPVEKSSEFKRLPPKIEVNSNEPPGVLTAVELTLTTRADDVFMRLFHVPRGGEDL